MTEPGKEQAPFDERAALGELERFRADIERYRKQRETVSEDFEEFVRSFPSPVDVFPSEHTEVRASGGPGLRRSGGPGLRESGGPGGRAPVERVAPAPPVRANPPAPKKPLDPDSRVPTIQPARPAPAPPPIERTRRAAPVAPATVVETPRRTRMPLVAALLLVLVVAAAGVWMFRGGQRQTPAPSSTAEQTAQPAAPVGSAPVPAPPPVAAPVPVESEITTVRRVWVRLIADGERVLERELPADTRVPFKAEKTIVIRTGDAGAVRLTIRGEDHGALGRDGEVVTRTFTVPATQSR